MSNDDEETYQSMLRISSNPYLTTGERTFVNSRLKNIKTVLDKKVETEQNLQYLDSVVSQGYIKQESPTYNLVSDAIKLGKYQQANQLITTALSKSADAAKLIRNRFEQLTDNHNRAVETGTEEVVSTSMAQLNSFIETTLPTLPPKYENYYRKKVQQGVSSTSQMFSTFEGILNLWNNGLEPTDKNFGRAIAPVNTNESGNQVSYKNINNIPENEFALPDSAMAEVNVGDTTQTVTGVAANNLVRSGRGNIVEDTAYAEIEMGSPSGNFGRVGAAISGIEQPGSITLSFKTGKRIPTLTSDFSGNLGFESMTLENGDEVMDKKTKERFPLIIKDQATTNMFPNVNIDFPPPFGRGTVDMKKTLATEGKYIVNGTTYTFDGLKEKFGVPLYQKQVRSRSTSEPMPVNANNVMQDTTLNIEDLQVRIINPKTGDIKTEIKY
jgi:DNA-binding protein